MGGGSASAHVECLQRRRAPFVQGFNEGVGYAEFRRRRLPKRQHVGVGEQRRSVDPNTSAARIAASRRVVIRVGWNRRSTRSNRSAFNPIFGPNFMSRGRPPARPIGFSSMMEKDEEGTASHIRAVRREVITSGGH